MNNTLLKGLCTVAVAAFMSGCADDEIAVLQVEKPGDRASYEYLNGYDVLKNYVNPKAGPDFRLGLALDAGEFNKRELVHALAVSNFSEITAGNAMKYASCVGDDGRTNFSKVEKFVATAKAAGLTIYGHTLAWHSQQNNKYLNSLIADKEVEDDGSVIEEIIVEKDFEDGSHIGGWGGATFEVVQEGPDGSKCMKITNEVAGASHERQSAIDMNFEPGTYHLSFKVKGTANGQIVAGFQNKDNYAGCGEFPKISITTEWQEVKVSANASEGANRFLFSYGDYLGSLYIDDLRIYVEKSGATVAIPVSVVKKDFEDGNHIGGWGGATFDVVQEGPDGSKCMTITNNSAGVFYSKQSAIDMAFEPKEYHLSFKVKGTVAGKLRAGFQHSADYGGRGDFPEMSVTTEWQEIDVATVASEGADRFLFSYGDYVGTLYIDDINIYYEKTSSSIPLTDEEKKEVLTTAMNTWVEGMMKATGGYVTTWDVVNEAISGDDKDDDGKYDLQSAKNVSADDAKNNFYWQDYLGNEDYVRIVVAAARKYYVENGGTEPLKLFINDYNLESDWDDNQKLKSLIEWIKVWESDGVTKIDGIGTQMHVSCYANPEIQASKEEHVVKMLELLAESGKLVKISELDMGYVDETEKSVQAQDMTEEQHLQMAHFYKFIIKKYFEIIPAAQQYGITQWCATDAKADSGWRKGEPVGLWDLNWNRKHTYAGFADGLAGKE